MATPKIITITLACFLAGCAHTTAEAIIGPSVGNGGFYPGHGIIATVRIKRHLTENTWCEYSHTSYLLQGPPFGPRTEEDSLNMVGCGIRIGDHD